MRLYGAQVSQNYIQYNDGKKRHRRYPASESYSGDLHPEYWQVQYFQNGDWHLMFYAASAFVAKEKVDYLNRSRKITEYRAVSPTGNIYNSPTFIQRSAI